jgi:hypothetical protein
VARVSLLGEDSEPVKQEEERRGEWTGSARDLVSSEKAEEQPTLMHNEKNDRESSKCLSIMRQNQAADREQLGVGTTPRSILFPEKPTLLLLLLVNPPPSNFAAFPALDPENFSSQRKAGGERFMDAHTTTHTTPRNLPQPHRQGDFSHFLVMSDDVNRIAGLD